jgi:uncharacterized membrane protein
MIPEVSLNYVSVALSAIALIVLGMIWYGPLFGKKWMSLMKIDPQKMKNNPNGQKEMMKSMGGMVIVSIVIAFALNYTLAFAAAKTLIEAVIISKLTWLGYVATIGLNTVLFEQKPVSLYLINVGYYLVGFVTIAIIVASMA